MESIMEARDYARLINGLETRPDDGTTDGSDPSLTQVKDIVVCNTHTCPVHS
jgi:hypothetical protein